MSQSKNVNENINSHTKQYTKFTFVSTKTSTGGCIPLCTKLRKANNLPDSLPTNRKS